MEFEKLFWKVIKNKFLFSTIKSFLKLPYNSIKYYDIKSIEFMISNGYIELLKDKVKRNETDLIFPCVFSHKYEDENDDESFSIIFETIKNDKEFYLNLFTNYNDYLISIDRKAKWSIKTKNLSALQVLIENFNFKPNRNSILIAIQSSSTSIEMIEYLLKIIKTSDGGGGGDEIKLTENEIWNDEKVSLLTIIQLINKFPMIINLNDQEFINGEKLKMKFKYNNPLLMKLSDLITACKLIFTIKYLNEIYMGIKLSDYFRITSINEIESDQLNLLVKDLSNNNNNNEDVLKLLILYGSINNEFILSNYFKFKSIKNQEKEKEKDEEYFNLVENSIIKNEYIYNLTIINNLNIALEYGNFEYVVYWSNNCLSKLKDYNNTKLIKINQLKKNNLIKDGVVNNNNNNNNLFKKEFINQLLEFIKINDNLISVESILLLIIESNDLELLKPILNESSKLNNNNIDFKQFSIITGHYIQNFIYSIEMLEFCFNNFKNSFEKDGLKNWYLSGRIDLIECYYQLWLKSGLKNDEIKNTKLISLSEIEVPRACEKSFLNILEYIVISKDEEGILDFDEITLFKHIKNIGRSSKENQQIRNIIENSNCSTTLLRYNPFNFTTSFIPTFIICYNYPWIHFMNWIFTYREMDIKSGRCYFNENDKSKYLSALYSTGRIDKLLEQISEISNFQILNDLFSNLGEKGDCETLDKILKIKEMTTTNSLIPIINQIDILLINAAKFSKINLFKYFLKNYEIFKKRSTTTNTYTTVTDKNQSLIKPGMFRDYLLNCLYVDNIVLFKYFYYNDFGYNLNTQFVFSDGLIFQFIKHIKNQKITTTTKD